MTIGERIDSIIQDVPLVVKRAESYFVDRVYHNLMIEGTKLGHSFGEILFR